MKTNKLLTKAMTKSGALLVMGATIMSSGAVNNVYAKNFSSSNNCQVTINRTYCKPVVGNSNNCNSVTINQGNSLSDILNSTTCRPGTINETNCRPEGVKPNFCKPGTSKPNCKPGIGDIVIPGLPSTPGEDEDITVPEVPGEDEDITVPEVPGEDEDITVPEVPGEDEDITVPEVPGEDEDITVPEVPGTGEDNTVPEVPEVDENVTAQAAYENKVLELVNVERSKQGLSPLQMDESVRNVARLKSQDMRINNYFDHTSPTYGSPFDMLKKYGISYRSAGENIAQGYPTPEAVVTGWMNSPGHRANILNGSFTHIGVGYDANGNYWTQMFIGK